MTTNELRPDYYKVTIRKRVHVRDVAPSPFAEATIDVDVEVQPFDIIRALGLDFFAGSLLKYLWRHDRKSQDPADRLADARKVLTYAQQIVDDATKAKR